MQDVGQAVLALLCLFPENGVLSDDLQLRSFRIVVLPVHEPSLGEGYGKIVPNRT